MNEMCITHRYLIIAYLLADREYPLLAPLAQNLLSAPASQAYVERASLRGS